MQASRVACQSEQQAVLVEVTPLASDRHLTTRHDRCHFQAVDHFQFLGRVALCLDHLEHACVFMLAWFPLQPDRRQRQPQGAAAFQQAF